MTFYSFAQKKVLITIFFLFSFSSPYAFSLTFQEQFNIGDDSNFARTKDADVADINADGWPDILDANSNNRENNTQVTIRFNSGGTGFSAEPVLEGPENDNVTTYDADLVDLNRDGYPDLIRTESKDNGINRISVYRNLKGVGTGGFGRTWFDLSAPSDMGDLAACPDDIDFADLNGDGWVDFVVARRTFTCANNSGSGVSVYVNTSAGNPNGEISFELSSDLPALSANASMHDVIIINADSDDYPDILALNERGRNELYVNRGGGFHRSFFPSIVRLGSNATTGAAGDFNLVSVDIPGYNILHPEGTESLVLADNAAKVINFYGQTERGLFNGLGLDSQPFQTIETPEFFVIYDIELGDYDLDGHLDVLVNGLTDELERSTLVIVRRPRKGSRGPRFEKLPMTLLPNQPNDDYLSGDALDYDLDGDLDIYVAGGDGDGPDGPNSDGDDCFGCVQNRFYENTIEVNSTYNNFENGLGTWEQGILGERDTHNWTINQGRTRSLSTGPARAKSGNSYLYLETSAGGANSAFNTAFLDSRILGNGSHNRHTLTFDYHMFGRDVGSLHVDVLKADGTFAIKDVLVIDGSQQSNENDQWRKATVNLMPSIHSIIRSKSAFEPTRFRVRIRAVAAGGYRGDIAIDNLMITTNQAFR